MKVTLQERPVRRAFWFMGKNVPVHFATRAPAWFMASLDFWAGIAMTVNPGILTSNPGSSVYYAHLVQWVSPEIWRDLFVAVGFTRLVALFVNGTYLSIWWTPHVRWATALISFGMWAQFAATLLTAQVLTLGAVAFSHIAGIEIFNIVIAVREAKEAPEGEIGHSNRG